jgi:hypothetical protein
VSWVPVKLSLRKFMPVKGSRTELSIEWGCCRWPGCVPVTGLCHGSDSG